jgi:opacity protein-like surface antigen
VRAVSRGVLLLLLVSSPVSGQSLVLQGSAGPTLSDAGYSVAAGIGFSPTSRLTVSLDVERTHLFSTFTSDGRGGSSAFRGGTVTLAAAELRVTLRGHDRASPYVFGGLAAGVSRPNVNEHFPNRVTNAARALFYGGGIQVPLHRRISVFGDARVVVGGEGNDGVLALIPVRAGVAWRF